MPRAEDKFRHIYPDLRGIFELTLSEMDEYVGATLNLVIALREKFLEDPLLHQSDTNEIGGWTSKDAFFRSDEPGFVFRIRSSGLPDDEGAHGMFLYVFVKEEGGEVREVLGLQTAKSPDAVRWEQAKMLTRFSLQQLGIIAEFVKKGTPVSKKEFGEIGILP